MDKPYALLAELTYACPLHCSYCSNPVPLDDYRDELTTDEWRRVFSEAAELGVLQVHLSGGEPLQRRDIVDLVQPANQAGSLHQPDHQRARLLHRRAEQLRDAGLDHVQVSIQADERGSFRRDRRYRVVRPKAGGRAARQELGWPLTLNVVLHRQNIDRIGTILDMAR